MSREATLRFYAELTDFLPEDNQSRTVQRSFDVPGSVKDLIEACGVPHTEVDLIIVNGESVDFSYRVRSGDRISVYPMFESFDIGPIVKVRPVPLRSPRFVADNHLGRLARLLRLLGFDTLYERDWGDAELAEISSGNRRTLLTRDIGLLKHSKVTHGYYVRATGPREQVLEVVRRFHLEQDLEPFTRCMVCNALLAEIDKGHIADRLPARTRARVDEYRICPGCNRLYWRGAHYSGLKEVVALVAKSTNSS